MPGLAFEIKNELVAQQIPFGDTADTPALVLAESARFEQGQFFAVCRRQFAGIHQFLRLGIHGR